MRNELTQAHIEAGSAYAQYLHCLEKVKELEQELESKPTTMHQYIRNEIDVWTASADQSLEKYHDAMDIIDRLKPLAA